MVRSGTALAKLGAVRQRRNGARRLAVAKQGTDARGRGVDRLSSGEGEACVGVVRRRGVRRGGGVGEQCAGKPGGGKVMQRVGLA